MGRNCQWGLSFAVFLSFFALVLSYRLPSDIVPEHYRLEILTNLGDTDGNFEFIGSVWIKTKCLHATNNITLHSKNLRIDDKKVTVTDVTDTTSSKPLTIAKTETDEPNDFYVVHMEDGLLVDGHYYEVFIPFVGKLEDVLAGFYRSSYEDKATKTKRYLATTQFESTDARRAFPCFDEPAMKATFQISMGHMDKYSAISNMPVEKMEAIKEKPGWSWTRFENSVPMSTYLVAFIVSDFEYRTSPQLHNNVTFRIWSRADALNQVEFARSVGPRALEYYENFFKIPYPLPKQDMIAIPDFSAGAMENWGLITYRETYLLYDPVLSQTASQHDVASVIAHELAHQWFGNLVTMKWWTDLWLNEGFATYMAAVAVEHLYPEWNSLEETSVNNLLTVFVFDSLESSHPVSVPIGHPKEIDQIFDTISYKKASYLIRMMSLFLGEETLRKGVSAYLEKHRYNNAEQDDLWESLTEEAHKTDSLPKNLTVKTIMDTWTLQTGYPVITVNRLYGQKSAELKQERFLRTNVKIGRSNGPCWWVPISYTSAVELDFNTTKPKHWLPCSHDVHKFEDFPEDDKWVILNIQSSGLYRVNYDEKNWKMLVNTLNSDDYQKIPVMSRVQLLDDASSLAWVGDLNYRTFFDIVNYLTRENKYVPWAAALRSIDGISRQLKRTSFYGELKVFMRALLTPVYEKVGGLLLSKSTQDKLDAVKHQVQIVSRSCRFNVADCVSDAKKIFDQFQNAPKNKEIVPKDLRTIIYCTAVRNGGEKEWNFLWQQYLTSNVAAEKSSILSALACTREIWLVQRYLEWTINPESGIRKQDSGSIFSKIASTDVGFYIAQTFLEEKLKEIYKSISPNTRRMSSYFGALAGQMTTEQEYDWLRNLTDTNKEYFKEAKQGVDQGLETVKLNIQWQKKHSGNIKSLLSQCEDD